MGPRVLTLVQRLQGLPVNAAGRYYFRRGGLSDEMRLCTSLADILRTTVSKGDSTSLDQLFLLLVSPSKARRVEKSGAEERTSTQRGQNRGGLDTWRQVESVSPGDRVH